MGQSGDVCDDAGAGGGKAGHDLETSMDIIGDLAVDDKGDRAKQRHHQPHQGGESKAFLLVETVSLWFDDLK